MRQSQFFLPTLREDPQEAEIASHRLMLRAGLVRSLASGIYLFLPLGERVRQKVERIVREEMNRIGALELTLSALQPAELWQESGRMETYGPELIRLHDRHQRLMVLGPTHEEVITALVRDEVQSYRQLPLTLYQIQTKFRDEKRPRFGVLRAREFLMKDAYSFDLSEEGLNESYEKMMEAYSAIFRRLGLNFRVVEADSGAIGGTDTHEFMVLSDVGEDTLVFCNACDYSANVERAEIAKPAALASPAPQAPLEKVATPGVKSIDEVSRFLDLSPQRLVKTLLFRTPKGLVAVLVRGDTQVNEIKVRQALQVDWVELAEDEEVWEAAGCPPGFIGPVGLKDVKILADWRVAEVADGVVGANEEDAHYIHFSAQRDLREVEYGDLRLCQPGDPCPRCGSTLEFSRGIEVGHVFKLGTKYSEKLGATFLDETGKRKPAVMGCYGIGITRVVAAIVEQYHDEKGIIWPESVAPFFVHILIVNRKDETQVRVAEELYQKFLDRGVEVLLDDRDERAGVKFNDADLIGIPWRIVVGKGVAEGQVEVKHRRSQESHWFLLDDFAALCNHIHAG